MIVDLNTSILNAPVGSRTQIATLEGLNAAITPLKHMPVNPARNKWRFNF